ncbi:hypothetical protein [Streptomyces sp. NPDC096339]|uniref:hypothetical protein n=1 Tax=Streptomyces sp. NPDC096339 TaxID=3366086 RepID=UPI0037F92015
MAEDIGVGLFGIGAAAVAGAAIGAQATAAALRVQYEDLKSYQILVNDLLTKLKESPADDGRLADGTLPAGALGKNFTQAEKLYKAYGTVHTELQKLSKGLAVQIEALGIAIQSASGGYSQVDEDTKRRMAFLAKQAHEQYVPKRDPYADKTADGGQPAAPNAPAVPQPNGKQKGAPLA